MWIKSNICRWFWAEVYSSLYFTIFKDVIKIQQNFLQLNIQGAWRYRSVDFTLNHILKTCCVLRLAWTYGKFTWRIKFSLLKSAYTPWYNLWVMATNFFWKIAVTKKKIATLQFALIVKTHTYKSLLYSKLSRKQ